MGECSTAKAKYRTDRESRLTMMSVTETLAKLREDLLRLVRALLHHSPKLPHALHPHRQCLAKRPPLCRAEGGLLILEKGCSTSTVKPILRRRNGHRLTLTGRQLPLGILKLGLVVLERRIGRFLIAELDEPSDKDLSVANNGTERCFALEDVLEGGAID